MELLKKFRNVFDLAYSRYNDIKQSEALAREANIEASLERVRSNAMAMHTPDDLSATVSLFFKELKSLNVLLYLEFPLNQKPNLNRLIDQILTLLEGTKLYKFAVLMFHFFLEEKKLQH